MTNLVKELQALIVETLNLEDITPEDIDPEAPLFGEGLGLDSIDALELGVAVQKRYGIKIEASSDETRRHFYSVNTLVRFISARSSVEGENC